MGEHTLLMEALFPPPKPKSERGKLLWAIRQDRAARAWMKPGCYAWWRYEDYIKARQKQLAEYRKSRSPTTPEG